MRTPSTYPLALALAVILVPAAARAADVRATPETLRSVLKEPKAGTRVLLAPGIYPKTSTGNLKGTPEQPIIIESADPKEPAVFEGGQWGLHVSKCAHLILRNFTVRNTERNGINVDDGGDAHDPSHHVVIDNLSFSGIGGSGNTDAVKLSGVTDFTVRNVTAEGWGGSGVDMVGCHRGLIENCTFRGKDGFAQASGVQIKGGSSGVTVRRCTFLNVTGRSVNVGGSTDRRYFRPADANYEAKEVTVEGCRIVGSDSPINFVGSDNCVARYNTIYEPKRYVVRILQESTYPGFVPSRNGRFENNIVVFSAGKLRSTVNVGDGTEPKSFTFANNLWHARDNPAHSRPRLPGSERGGIHDVNPKLKDPDAGDLTATAAPKDLGADALPAAKE